MSNKKEKSPFLEQSEKDIKSQVKDYLAIKGLFNFPILQGIGAYRGIPDRVLHFKGKVVYLEIKKLGGKLSKYQEEFGEQCALDGIDYFVVRSIEDLQGMIELD